MKRKPGNLTPWTRLASRRIVGFVGAAGLLLVGAAGCGSGRVAPCDAGAGECIALSIPRGATLRAAVDSLSSHGLVGHNLGFTIYARLRGLGTSLKSGIYAFRRGTRWGDIVAALKLGRGTLTRFTVREGLQAREIADLATQRLGVSRDSFLVAAEDPALLQRLGLTADDAETAEGYLYPTTYTVRPNLPARDLVHLMADEFVAHWQPSWQARLDSLGMTRHQIVTLASIIEGEVRYGPDRDYVSAVYHNRLKRGMLLQADPTVVYAAGRRLRRVYEKTLMLRSPYNTYQHPGLPPGPINQPDSASLAAALYPAPAPFLYFVAQPDGKHIFSVTYPEHLAAIRLVKEMRTAARAPQPRRR